MLWIKSYTHIRYAYLDSVIAQQILSSIPQKRLTFSADVCARGAARSFRMTCDDCSKSQKWDLKTNEM